MGSYTFPFPFWPLQIGAVNELAPLPRSGYYAEVGTGKTPMSTAHALYQQDTGVADCHIITVPPIIITQWMRWLEKIPGADAIAYRGTPRQRKQINLTVRDQQGRLQPAARFIVMSMQIFKQDYGRIYEEFKDLNPGLMVDEATAIKNCGSQNFKAVNDFSAGRALLLLTGTPLAKPNDAYAYIKLLAPLTYRNKRVFDSIHVEEADLRGNVRKWGNLDILQKNMKVNAVRLLKKDVLPDLPLPIYQPIPYELTSEHYALYNQLAEDKILELESGGKIDATSVSKLFSCMQQVILNWDYFSECETNIAAGFELLDEVLSEVGAGQDGGRKLIVVSNYQMTSRAIARRYQAFGVGVINGEVRSEIKRQEIIDGFISDPKRALLNIQPQSGGYGTDGLQHVSSDVLLLECPSSPILFEQVVGRVYRAGQKNPPLIRIAVAEKTIQVKLHRLLLNNEELATFVQGGWRSLREALYGG